MKKRGRTTIRPITIETGVNIHAEGSALISMGNTRVLCTASVEEKVPNWMAGKGKGWVTAEYGMLPRSTSTRMNRERGGKTPSRSLEISRLIGRALRAGVDMEKLGERLITIDCDVIQADGGTRTAAITGGMVALAMALKKLQDSGRVTKSPLVSLVAAVSVGIVDGKLVVDLDYDLDHRAEVDMNVAMTAKGKYVEVQGSAEGKPFSHEDMQDMLAFAAIAIRHLVKAQKAALAKL